MVKVQPVDTIYVSQVWPMVEGYLQDSLDKGGEACGGVNCYNIHHIQMFLTTGQWLLLVATDENNQIQGAMTVSFMNYPMQRIAFITLTGGRFVINDETYQQLEVILRQRGATVVQAYVRKSVERLLSKQGFTPITTLVENKL